MILKNAFLNLGKSKMLIAVMLIVTACILFWISSRDFNFSTPKTVIEMPLIHAVAVDDTYVYWSTLGSLKDDHTWNDDVAEAKIMRAKKDGSSIEALASGLYTPWDIAVDDMYVYWISVCGTFSDHKDGGKVELLEGVGCDRHYGLNGMDAGDIEVDSDNVYWVNYDNSRLNVMNKITKEITDIDLGDTYWDIELQGDYIYGLDGEDNKTFLWRINKDGTGLTRKYLQNDTVSSFSIDDVNVYWGVQLCFSENSGNVMKMSLNEQTPSILASTWDCNSGPVDLTSDEDYLYWNTNFATFTQNLVSLPKQGGNPHVLAHNVFVSDIAVDSNGLFFTTREKIVFIAKNNK